MKTAIVVPFPELFYLPILLYSKEKDKSVKLESLLYRSHIKCKNYTCKVKHKRKRI